MCQIGASAARASWIRRQLDHALALYGVEMSDDDLRSGRPLANLRRDSGVPEMAALATTILE